MKTATAVLATIPAQLRPKRHQVGGAEQMLDLLAQFSADFQVLTLAQGVLYANATGRSTGTVAMAIRKATAWQAAQLVVAMAADDLGLIAQVPAWLNAKALEVLA